MNYSPQADKVGANPETDKSVAAQRVINSGWTHELIRLVSMFSPRRNPLLICLVWIPVMMMSQPGPKSKQLSIIPDLRLKMLNGTSTTLYAMLEDGPILIDFWATWCEPCKKAMVHLESLHNQYQDQGFKVLSINQDSPKSLSKVRSYIRSRGYSFLVAIDSNQRIATKLNARLLPTTILVDRNGRILWRHQGYLPGDEKEFQRRVQQLLESENHPSAESTPKSEF